MTTETQTSETSETRDTAPNMPLEPIARCTCGVQAGRAHYCADHDHNWIKAPELPALED